MELAKLAAGGVAGAIGAKYLTQMVLQDKNQGPTGYAVTALAAVALAWGAGKVGAGKDIATGILVGGLTAAGLRFYQDSIAGTSPMSGLGDPDMLGLYQPGTYPAPFWNYGTPALPTPASMAVTPSSLAPTKKGSRYGS